MVPTKDSTQEADRHTQTVEVSKNGNWRLQRAEHGVGGSERVQCVELRILTPEPPSVSYGCSAAGTNQKTAP
eukprot:1512872-Prymnesium_polylepis.1